MLISRPQSKIVSKIIRTKSGDLVRVYFLVTEYQGKFYVKLLKTETLGREFRTEEKLRLEGKRAKTRYEIFDKIGDEIASPYQDFNFFISQLTRAPALV